MKDFPKDIIPHMSNEEFVHGNRFIKGNIEATSRKELLKGESSVLKNAGLEHIAGPSSVHYSRHRIS